MCACVWEGYGGYVKVFVSMFKSSLFDRYVFVGDLVFRCVIRCGLLFCV